MHGRNGRPYYACSLSRTFANLFLVPASCSPSPHPHTCCLVVARNATARPTQLEDLLNPIKVVNLEKKILVASDKLAAAGVCLDLHCWWSLR